jgi:hypothetical protein
MAIERFNSCENIVALAKELVSNELAAPGCRQMLDQDEVAEHRLQRLEAANPNHFRHLLQELFFGA